MNYFYKQLTIPEMEIESEIGVVGLNIRQKNIRNSPKNEGNSDIDSVPFLEELSIKIIDNKQPIQFTSNFDEAVHRWAPYVQGFSASFVQSIFDKYNNIYRKPKILDPFAGCGTVTFQSKINGFDSIGTELNPLLHFIATTKTDSLKIHPELLQQAYRNLRYNTRKAAPTYLKSKEHFHPEVLGNLELIRGSINAYEEINEEASLVKKLMKLAFSSILIDCSYLKRSPCLGYAHKTFSDATIPFSLMDKKIAQISDDIRRIRHQYSRYLDVNSTIHLANAMDHKHENKYDLIITSPPYMNGMDYVINYKIEMGWLDFTEGSNELKKIKDEMVVCDNVSKSLIRSFKPIYSNSWIENIKVNIAQQIQKRGSYRRTDMPLIVHKYFDDMYRVMANVVRSLNCGGRFILVVGDSLIADVYIQKDLLIAKIGTDLGLQIETIEKARTRRSGQIRSYKLRESIITLRK